MAQIDDAGGPERDDALMYAVTGDPVPAAVADLPGFARDREDAESAVASLRRGLAVLGAELAQESAPTTAPARPARAAVSRWWLRPPMLAAAAAVTGLALAAGVGLTMTRPADSPKSGSRSVPGIVACADTIMIGKVSAVRPQGDRTVVTVDAERYLKPATGPDPLTITEPVPAPDPAAPAWQVGERVMLVVYDAATGDLNQFTGADIATEWDMLAKAEPYSRNIDTTTCDEY